MVVTKDYSKLPRQEAFKVSALDVPPYSDVEMDIRSTIRTNDISVNWTTGEPGDTIDWHSHAPDMYQIRAIISGESVWHYRDNDGEERTITGREGEVVFLPPGMENKVRVVGDEAYHQIGVTRRSRGGRLERLLGESSEPARRVRGLVYDDMNGRVVDKHEAAVVE